MTNLLLMIFNELFTEQVCLNKAEISISQNIYGDVDILTTYNDFIFNAQVFKLCDDCEIASIGKLQQFQSPNMVKYYASSTREMRNCGNSRVQKGE